MDTIVAEEKRPRVHDRKIIFRLPEKMDNYVKHEAKKLGVKKSDYIRIVLANEMRSQERGNVG